jgi:SAM-dependent methyltransferase
MAVFNLSSPTRANSHDYDDDFFDTLTAGSLRSARVIVPILLTFIGPKSVIELGCGRGAWLKVFEENGVNRVQGIDGSWIDQSKLLIDSSKFKIADLSQPFRIDRQFDLALCLEVVEHLPSEAGESLIAQLTRIAPLVLFSAAIPGQGGVGHLNEQWPRYWVSVFSRHGYCKLDPIRRHIIQDSRVEWWYRQNILLFAHKDAIANSSTLRVLESQAGADLDWIHRHVVEALLAQYADNSSLRMILKKLPRAALRAIKNRCGVRRSSNLK